MVWTPLVSCVVFRLKYPTGPGEVPFCAQLVEPLLAYPGNSWSTSQRARLYTGLPSDCPSTKTKIVDPLTGMMHGWLAAGHPTVGGVSAHPKLVTLPDIVAPWPGVSIAPNGSVAAALFTVMVFVPRSSEVPVLLCAIA